jgi:hypothetical protein
MLHLPHVLSTIKLRLSLRSAEPTAGILPAAVVTFSVTFVPLAAGQQHRARGSQTRLELGG